MIPEYRKDFFYLLKKSLQEENIELILIYGNKNSSYKSGQKSCNIEWGKYVESKQLNIGGIELCWQPVVRFLKNKDLIIVEQANKLLINYFIMLLKPFWNNKLGFWGHGKNLQGKPDSLGNKFRSLFLKKCDWWWAYTRGVKKFLLKNGFPDNRITIVNNAINTTALRNQCEELNESEIIELKKQFGIDGDKVGIFCGGMYFEKKIEFILEACFIIKKEIPDFHMIFIGAGSEVPKVENASKLNGWIHYVGTKIGKEKIKYFKIASIQLMPASVGLGILDSFALEVPIFTIENNLHGPEIEYLESGKNGIITKNSLADYSESIIEALKSNTYSNLKKGCRSSSEKYTINAMVENFKNGILTCLKSC